MTSSRWQEENNGLLFSVTDIDDQGFWASYKLSLWVWHWLMTSCNAPDCLIAMLGHKVCQKMIVAKPIWLMDVMAFQ